MTGREIRFRKTCKAEQAAQIELGRLLAQAATGRQPDSAVTVARVTDAGVVRVVLALPSWDDYLPVALDDLTEFQRFCS